MTRPLATLSGTLSVHFVENGRKSTKCFDKVQDKVVDVLLLGQALVSPPTQICSWKFSPGDVGLTVVADPAEESVVAPAVDSAVRLAADSAAPQQAEETDWSLVAEGH